MAIYRKLVDSIARRGIVGTLSYVGAASMDGIRWRLDSWYDILHRVDTSGKISIADLKVPSANADLAIWYEPVPTACFRQLMQHLPIKHEEYVFVDFGSGKGRVLFMASDYPFARVVGVEFSPELHDVALRNIQTYRNMRQRCHLIESVCMDAADFELPLQPAVLFFYSPFKAPLLRRILESIKESLSKCPRSLYILFIGVIPESIEVLQNCGMDCQEVALRRDHLRGITKRGFVIQQGPESSSRGPGVMDTPPQFGINQV